MKGVPNIKCYELRAELSSVSFSRDCLVGRRDLLDSGAAAGGFRSGFRLDIFHNICSITYSHIDEVAHARSATFSHCNMNGRVYDPVIGRFLSPDPYIQAPYFVQNFDRYSYVWNNPLKYVDPSGYKAGWWDSVKNWYHFHVKIYIRRQTLGLEFEWEDPYTSDAPWAFGLSSSGGGAGGGAPLGGSAASGPGLGGGGAAPLNLGGDGGPGDSGRNSNSVSGIPLGKRPQKKSYNSAPVKYQPISTSDESSTDNSDMFYLAPLTTEQILFNEIAGQIALYEPTPYGEAVVGAVNLIFLVYNNAPTLEMSRYKPGMQGGGQNVRDKGLKGFPDGFRKWLHKQKENGAPDFNNKEVWELYKQWVEEGCPVPYK